MWPLGGELASLPGKCWLQCFYFSSFFEVTLAGCFCTHSWRLNKEASILENLLSSLWTLNLMEFLDGNQV